MISFTILIFFSYKFGINRYGFIVFVVVDNFVVYIFGLVENRIVEKIVFDVKLEKFEAASKIKVNKEIKVFTELGLKGFGGDENLRRTTISVMFE